MIGRCRGHRRADQHALDASPSAAHRTATFGRILGGDQMSWTGALEVLGLLPNDAHVAVANMRSEHLLLAGEVALQVGILVCERWVPDGTDRSGHSDPTAPGSDLMRWASCVGV